MSSKLIEFDDYERCEKLLRTTNAPEIFEAASGLRPPFDEQNDALPVVDGRLRMAPSSATYAVSRYGDGTEVMLFGTTPEGHSAAIRVTGFYPYMYVRLGSLDPRRLIAELDATLLAITALEGDKREWATPEYTVMREASIGKIYRGETQSALIRPHPRDTNATQPRRPIVGWELVDGTLLRGSGDDRGYRGLESEQFVKIYFYMPNYVSRAKQILHGVHNARGARAQVERLSNARTSIEDRLTAEAVDVAERQKAAQDAKKPIGRTQERTLDSFVKSWVPHGDTGEGKDDENDDDASSDDQPEKEDDDNDDDDDDVDEDETTESDVDAVVVHTNHKRLDGDNEYEQRATNDEVFRYSDGSVVTESAILARLPKGADDMILLGNRAKRLMVEKALDALDALRAPDIPGYLNDLSNRCTLTVCEADIDFILRFAIDAGFSFNQFIEIDTRIMLTKDNCHFARRPGTFGAAVYCSSWQPIGTPPGVEPSIRRVFRPDNQQQHRRWRSDPNGRQTTAQIEVHCDIHHIRLSPDAELQRSIPRRVRLSLDCEMETHGSFPRPASEAVLQIGCVIQLHDGRRREIGFTIGQVARGAGEFIVDDEHVQSTHTGGKRRHMEIAYDAEQPKRRFVRTLPADVESEHILCFADESIMLLAFAQFIRVLSPDVIISFNGDNFDMPYLAERARVLGIDEAFVGSWGVALQNAKLKIRDRTSGSTATGKHEYKEVTASGRLFYDLFQYLKRNPMIKLRSYSLNAVALEYIGMEKENVAYSQIDELQQTPEGRRKLLTYCIRDSLLPMLVDEKRTISHELLEKSRGTGVPIEMLLKRGMQIQCKTYLYRKSRQGMLVPLMAKGIPTITDAGERRLCVWYTRTDEERAIEMRGEKFDGATVFEPKRGLHEEPVVTLDFRSLYPSIMASGNYCASTLLAPNFVVRDDVYFQHLVATGQRTWDELFISVGTVLYDPKQSSEIFDEKIDANARRFIRHDVLRGFVPDIERELLVWRDNVKKELKGVEKQLEAAKKASPGDHVLLARLTESVCVLKNRQLSIKLIANALYGCFGAKTSFAYCVDLADAVTRRGRAALLYARHLTECVVNVLTPNHPQALEVAKFAGLRNQLVSLDAGKDVVERLCIELNAVQSSKPRNVRSGSTRAASGVTTDIKSFFGAIARKRERTDEQTIEKDDIDSTACISCVYGDTDSTFIGFWRGIDFDAVGRIAVLMAQFISISLHTRWATRNADDNLYQFDVEKGFRTLLLLKKKRYVGAKYLWKGGKFVPENEKNEFEPNESGLETQRRDTTRLVSEHMTPVLSMLIDYRYSKEEKLRRATSFIYHTMVGPLLDGTIQKRLIIQTRQLRKLPREYLEKSGTLEQSLPIHVQMALRAERELGGPNAPGVPKSGDRIAFVVARGDRGAKSSSRGVDPLHALDNDVEIDAQYYLERHVAKALCRIFEPIIVGDRTDIPGTTEKARERARLEITHERLFGSRTEFRKPVYADQYEHVTREYNVRSRFVDDNKLVRYRAHRAASSNKLIPSPLGKLTVTGGACVCCSAFFVGEVHGYVCTQCAATEQGRRHAEARFVHTLTDLEELARERAAIYEHCQRCAHTERCPTSVITCDESGCDTFWERMENQKALREADRRLASATRAMHTLSISDK